MENTNQKHLELIDDMSFNNEIFKKLKLEEKENNLFIHYWKKIKQLFITQFFKKPKMNAFIGMKKKILKIQFSLY